MNPKRTFLALIITAMMAATATAQSNDKRAIWEELMRHKIGAANPESAVPDASAQAQSNDKRNTWEELVRHKVGAASPQSPVPDASAQAQSRYESQVAVLGRQSVQVAVSDPPTNRLEGTWLVTAVTVEDPSQTPFKVLFTFMAGRDENEGTSMDTNDGELTSPIIGTPDQGVWRRTGDRRFINTHLAFLFDETATPAGAPFGSAKVRDVITLDKKGNEFNGRQYVEVFDPHGNLIFVFNVIMHGVRVQAEEPPPLP